MPRSHPHRARVLVGNVTPFTAQPRRGPTPWLRCPRCGNVSRASGYRHADGTCVSISQCQRRQEEARTLGTRGWTRIEAGCYDLTVSGEVVAGITNEGTSRNLWHWYARGESGDESTLDTAMANVERIIFQEAQPMTESTTIQTGRVTPPTRSAGVSLKVALFDSLIRHSDPRGRVYLANGIEGLAREVGAHTHEVTHLLNSLQKQSLITFSTRKEGNANVIFGIRLQQRNVTNAVRAANKDEDDRTPTDEAALLAADVALESTTQRINAWMEEPMPEPEPEPEPDSPAQEPSVPGTLLSRGRRPAYRPPAPGQDGEPPIVRALADLLQYESGNMNLRHEAVRERYVARTEAHEHAVKVLNEWRTTPGPMAALHTVPEPEPSKPDLTQYPLLVALTERDAKRRHAVEAVVSLEKAGLVDLGAQVLTAIPDDTEVERQMLDLLAAMGVA